MNRVRVEGAFRLLLVLALLEHLSIDRNIDLPTSLEYTISNLKNYSTLHGAISVREAGGCEQADLYKNHDGGLPFWQG